MDRSSPYYRQVELLVRALPYVADEPCFALRGGTAINLFHLPMPRLSVDIDLTYVPIEERGESLANARQALQRIANTMISSSPQLKARFQRNKEDELRVVVTEPDAQVAIELSPVMRGCIHEPMQLDVHAAVQREFGFASMAVLQPPDLYGGKICAALDRQHPRDLFDIKLLLDVATRRFSEKWEIAPVSCTTMLTTTPLHAKEGKHHERTHKNPTCVDSGTGIPRGICPRRWAGFQGLPHQSKDG
jgi:predicted nucleotidyltransferase component of viral defense system